MDESHYQWDEDDPNDEETSSFRASALRTLKRGYCNELNDSCNAVMRYINSDDRGDTHDHHPHTCQLASAKTGGQPPVYNHRACKHTIARPRRSHESNQTLSGYWEINGTKAHCLLDSGCEE